MLSRARVAVIAGTVGPLGLLVLPAAPAAARTRHRAQHHGHRITRVHRKPRVHRTAKRRKPPPPVAGTGYDISYPQCSHPYPRGGAFGIVGVNSGLANNANPCLAGELAWAAGAPGSTSPSQPPASLYLNTADPGNTVPDWPTPANGSAGGTTPYGTCDGSWSQACSYVYGQQRGSYSYGLVATSGSAVNPATVPWWLDVETINSWATPASNPGWAALNIAALQGFAAGLRGSGATGSIGFYSTATQWQAITGQNAQTTATYFPGPPPAWVAGAGTAAQAQAGCAASFTGGHVQLSQFASNGYDADLACA